MTPLREAAQRLLEARDRFGWSVEVDRYFHALRDVLASEPQAEPQKLELFCAFGTYEGRPIALADYAGRTEGEVISKVLATARREGHKGTAAARMKSLGWTIGPLYTHPAPPVEQPTTPIPEDIDAQDWAGMDGAIAYHLIERHSETWDHAGRLMHAWRDANPPESLSTQAGHIPDAGKMVEQPGAVGLSEREAFEAEMRCEDVWGHRSLKRDHHGADYANHLVQFAWEVWQARAALATQPAAPGRAQHDADSAELRSLCQARDQVRRQRDALLAEMAGHEAAIAHLSNLNDDLRRLLAEAMRVMKALHESATPDDGPDIDAIIPADAFRQFVDDNANLMHLIHISPHELPPPPAATQGAQS